MKQKAEIIQDLEENEILPRLRNIETLQGEVNALQATVSALRMLNGDSIPQKIESSILSPLQNYPGYPLNESLIDKYTYLENKHLKLWNKDDFDNQIEKMEGPEKGAVTLKDGRKKIYYYTQIGKLIRVTFGGKRKYTFFSTRLEWFQFEEVNGKKQYQLLSAHLPRWA